MSHLLCNRPTTCAQYWLSTDRSVCIGRRVVTLFVLDLGWKRNILSNIEPYKDNAELVKKVMVVVKMSFCAALWVWYLLVVVIFVTFFLEKAVKKKEVKEEKAKGIQRGPIHHNCHSVPKITALLIFYCDIPADGRVLKELQQPAKKGTQVWLARNSWNKSPSLYFATCTNLFFLQQPRKMLQRRRKSKVFT